MIGHMPIVQFRKQGLLPIAIFVDESKVCSDWFNPGEKYGEVWDSDFPHVCILPGEQLDMLDLRFSVGAAVHISADSENRAKALLEAFKGAGARLVVSSYCAPVDGKSYYRNEWIGVYRND